jgi:hypothetical protein
MSSTVITSQQIKDGVVQRSDLNVTTSGQSVVAKILQGNLITLGSSGADAGTGDVTINHVTSGVTSGSYGSSSAIPILTIDAYGHITAISTSSVNIVSSLAGLSDVTLTSPSANQVLQYNGTKWVNAAAPTTYTLPIATSSILGGIKVGSGLAIDAGTGILSATGGSSAIRTSSSFTATAAQTTFTFSYNPGFIDVFYNGSRLSSSEYTATNGTTVVLGTACVVNDIVDIISYAVTIGGFTGLSSGRTLTINGVSYDLSADRTWSITNASLGAQPQLNGTGLVRMSGTTVSYDNASYATQTYVTTAVSNLVASAPSTLDTLNELAAALGNDANFATTVATSIGTKQAQLNGTGFVKISGTTVSYDNSTYLTTGTASSTYLPLAGGTLTGSLSGTSATFNSSITTSLWSKFYNVNVGGAASGTYAAYSDAVIGNGNLHLVTTSGAVYVNSALSIPVYINPVGGNVAIGHSSPSAKLDIYAGANSTSNTVLWGQIIRNEGNANTTGYGTGLKLKLSSDAEPYKWAGIAAVAGTGYSNRTDLALYTAATSTADAIEKVRITGDGYVGINTINPKTTLNVQVGSASSYSGGGPSDSIRVSSGNTNAWMSCDYNGSMAYYGATSGGTAKFAGYNYATSASIDMEIGQSSMFVKAGGNVLVNYSSVWNNEKFGVQIANSAGWSSVPAIMRLTNYGSGYIPKITFTDSSIIDGWFGMVPISGGSYFAMGFSGYTEQGFKLYQNGSLSINASSIGYSNTKLQVNGTSTTDENAGTVFIQHSFSGTNGFGLSISRNGISAAALSLGADSSNNAIVSANNTNLRLGKNTSGTFYEYLNINTNGNSVFSGNVLPVSDAVYTLGSPSFRWNHVYTTDLHLSNEGKQNIVDGTWGDWTLQEGENDIFMLNNRSGEKFKMKLEKV